MTATTAPHPQTTDVVYDLEGTLLEACSCGVLCPCWVGEDPDQGDCSAVLSYNFTTGTIRGVDVSGLSVVNAVYIPGNVLAGDWQAAIYVDERASDEQLQAIVDALSGKLGGPLADLAALIGQVLGVERAPISHEIREGAGTLRVGDFIEAEMTPYVGADGSTTTLQNTIFSTVPGSPAYAGKASRHDVRLPQHGMEWSFEDRNAIQSDWKMRHVEAA